MFHDVYCVIGQNSFIVSLSILCTKKKIKTTEFPENCCILGLLEQERLEDRAEDGKMTSKIHKCIISLNDGYKAVSILLQVCLKADRLFASYETGWQAFMTQYIMPILFSLLIADLASMPLLVLPPEVTELR